MQLTFDDLQKLVFSKESNSLEFKETTGQLTRGMETGCAFMNSIGGGHLLFGISDSGTIIGQEVSDKTRKEIAGTLNKFEPTTFVETQYIEVPNTNRFVIALHFQDVANRKPYCFDGRAYIKIESTTSVMPQEAYNELLMSRKKEQIHWELLTNKKIIEDLLDRDRIIGTIRLGIEHGRLPESAMEVMDIPILLNKLDLIVRVSSSTFQKM